MNYGCAPCLTEGPRTASTRAGLCDPAGPQVGRESKGGVPHAGPWWAAALEPGEGQKCHRDVSVVMAGLHSLSSPPGHYEPCSVLTTETSCQNKGRNSLQFYFSLDKFFYIEYITVRVLSF